MQVLEHPTVASSDQLEALLEALTALRNGNPDARLPLHWGGVAGKVADVFNEVVQQNADMAAELQRLSQVVGKEGKIKQRAALRTPRGFCAYSVD